MAKRIATAIRIYLYFGGMVLPSYADQAAFAADAQNGARLAQRWCVSCHLVSKAQTTSTDAAPAFSAIAQRPEFDAEKLVFFLLDPHPVMPNMSLTRTEAQDLAAYIAAQR